jgi:hypothetical protein
MRLAADTECYGKGTDAEPACTAPGCKGRQFKDPHDLLASESTSVNALEYNKDEDEESCVNMIAARA